MLILEIILERVSFFVSFRFVYKINKVSGVLSLCKYFKIWNVIKILLKVSF